MKILHVIPSLSPKFGGPSKLVSELCESLAATGHGVEIYTTDRGGTADSAPKGVKVNCFRVDLGNPWGFSYGFYKNLSAGIRKFDIAHIHSLYLFTTTCAAALCRRNNIPYIIRPHGSLDPYLVKRHPFRKALYTNLVEKANLRGAAAIHYTTSEEKTLAEGYLKGFGIADKGIVVPGGVYLSDYEKLPEKGLFRGKHNLAGKTILLFMGRINFKKGLDILIKALAEVSKKDGNAVLVIAGPDNDNYSAEVKKWISGYGLDDRVLFTGMLRGRDKLALMRDSDIFVLSSYTENFGIAVVEAMAAGRPVIISDKINIFREVSRENAGIVIQCDAGQLAEAVLRLAGDPALRAKLGESARRFVRGTYSWDKVVRAMTAEYAAIIERKHK